MNYVCKSHRVIMKVIIQWNNINFICSSRTQCWPNGPRTVTYMSGLFEGGGGGGGEFSVIES